jgi:hypothetical protein
VPAPFEWRIARFCEEFHCTPTVAMAELDRLPMGLVDTILLLRGYASAKRDLEAAKERGDKKSANDPRFDVVNDIHFAMAEERLRARRETST